MRSKTCPSCNLTYATYQTRTNVSKNGSPKLPMLLKCGHTFCESCLSSKILKKRGLQSQQITCPTCKNSMILPNGIKDVHTNLYLLGQLEVCERSRFDLNLGGFVPDEAVQRKARKSGTEQFVRKCKLCNTTNASCKCLECDSIMCSDCFEKFHKVSAAIRQHQPIPLLALRNETLCVSPNCEEHDRLIEYYCTEDNAAICSRCYIVGKHKNHAIVSFEEKNKELLNDIEAETETAQKVVRLLDKSDEKLASLVPDYKQEMKKVVETITESFLHIHTLLQIREMEITESLTEIFKNVTAGVEEKRESFCINRMNIEASIKDAKMLIENNALVIDSAGLLENLRAAKNIPCVVQKSQADSGMSFEWNETCKGELIKAMQSFGNVMGSALENLNFLSLEKAPPGLEDEDNDDRASIISSVSTSGRKKMNRLSSTVSSSDGVVIENSDADSDVSRPRQPQKDSASDSSKQIFQEKLVMPVIKGRAQKVTVTHIRSPNNFLVQLTSNKRKYETLAHNINTWCRREASAKHIPNNVEVGSYVLARYSEDKSWYRAKVLGLTEDHEEGKKSSKIHVQYIDYGNEEFVSMKELRNMEKRFMLYPVFIIQCCLRDLAPYDEQKPWSPDTIAEFQKMTENQVFLLSVFSEKNKLYEVDLMYIPTQDVLDDGYVSVRDTLVFLELARFKTHSDAAKHLLTPPSYKLVDFIKPTCVKSGTTVDVIVTSVESPSKFHIVCQGDERVYYLNMHEEMQQMYGNDVQNIYSLYYPRLNIICSVLSKDGLWYRAKVTSSPKHRQVTVSLVDTGFTLVVGCDRIKKLHSKFVKLPAQAIACCLADVSPVAEARSKWTAEAKHWCKTKMAGAAGMARVKRWGETSELVLWLGSKMRAPTNQSVNFSLVEMGFAISTGLSSVGATQDSLYDAGAYSAPPSKQVSRDERIPEKTGGRVLSDPVSSPESRGQSHTDSSSSSVNDTPHISARHRDMQSPPKKTMQPSGASKSKSAMEKPKRSPKKAKTQKQATEQASEAEQTAQREKERVQKDIMRALSSDGASSEDNSGSIYIEVIISSYMSPSDFYLRVQDKEDQLVALMGDMQAEYQDSSASLEVKWEVGNFCAVKSPENNSWYRGKVLACDPDYLIEMVDYGYHEVVDNLNMRPLKRIFGEFMACAAVRCHVANLVAAGSGDPTKWSRTAIEFMKTETKDRKLYIKQEGDLNDQGLPIDIILETEIPETAFDPAIRMYHSLRQAILDKGLAMPTKRVSQPLASDFDTLEPFQKVIFEKQYGLYETESETECPLLAKGDNVSLPPTLESKSAAIIETISQVSTTDVVGHLTAEEEHNGSLEQAVVEPIALPPIPSLLPNATIDVYPTYLDGNGVFYVQLKEWEDMAIHLDYELQRVYSSVSCIPNKQWQEDELCVAYFSTDGRWYRAMVTEIVGDEVKVYYIDYGNTETIKQSDLRGLLPEFGKVHPLAYPCKLHDIVPSTLDNWPRPVLEYMHELMVNVCCAMKIVKMEEGSLLEVELTKTSGLHLGCSLVEQGMASRISDLTSEYERSGLVTRVLATINPFPVQEVGDCGETFEATLSYVELPNLIYVQRAKVADTNELDFVRSGEIAKINSMLDEFDLMAERLNSCNSMPLSQLPDVGFMCAGQFNYDDKWYRALVVDSDKRKGTCLVLFVDYGNSEVLPLERLRQLQSEFWTFPAQAIRVYFNIVPPSGMRGMWKRDSINEMVNALADKEILVKITHTDPLTAELLTAGENGEMRLAYESVIESGLALLPESRESSDELDVDVIVEAVEQVQVTDSDEEDASRREPQVKLGDSGAGTKVDWWGPDIGEDGAAKMVDEAVCEETNMVAQTEGDDDLLSSGDEWTTDDDEEEEKGSDTTLVKENPSP